MKIGTHVRIFDLIVCSGSWNQKWHQFHLVNRWIKVILVCRLSQIQHSLLLQLQHNRIGPCDRRRPLSALNWRQSPIAGLFQRPWQWLFKRQTFHTWQGIEGVLRRGKLRVMQVPRCRQHFLNLLGAIRMFRHDNDAFRVAGIPCHHFIAEVADEVWFMFTVDRFRDSSTDVVQIRRDPITEGGFMGCRTVTTESKCTLTSLWMCLGWVGAAVGSGSGGNGLVGAVVCWVRERGWTVVEERSWVDEALASFENDLPGSLESWKSALPAPLAFFGAIYSEQITSK